MILIFCIFFSFLHLTSSYVFFFIFVLVFNPNETTHIKLISPTLFAVAPIHSTLPVSVPFFLTRFSILP